MRALCIDVGTGTQDILLADTAEPLENAVRLVMPSPTAVLARRIRALEADPRPLLLTGRLMGGGPVAWAAQDRVRASGQVHATPEAARTFDDDLDQVRALGIHVVEDPTQAPANAVTVELRDLDVPAIAAALRAFDVDPHVDVLAVAVFDHGNAPPGYSDRLFRFEYLAETIGAHTGLDGFAHRRSAVPDRLTRCLAVVESARAAGVIAPDPPPDHLHANHLVLMDTGLAAVRGALEDTRAAALPRVLVVNVGNFHTLAFHVVHGQIAGLFEHHTGLLDQPRLETLLRQLWRGDIRHDEVFAENGHGALWRGVPAGEGEPVVVVIGPRRRLLHGSALHPLFAAPFGDMMLAGCYGLLRGVAEALPQYADEITAALASAREE